jgi:hypothetical protein
MEIHADLDDRFLKLQVGAIAASYVVTRSPDRVLSGACSLADLAQLDPCKRFFRGPLPCK